MIVVAILEGLGNQMFQYATARAQSLKLGVPLALDTRWFEHCSRREYGLKHFSISTPILDETKASEWIPLKIFKQYFGFDRRRWYERLAQRIYLRVRTMNRRKILEQKSHALDPRVLNLNDGTYLLGFWEAVSYFSAYREVLLKDFVQPRVLGNRAQELADAIDPEHSVAVHVRRGDRLTNAVYAERHGIVGEDYYGEALTIIRSKVDRPQLVVFSDNQGVAQAMFGDEKNVLFIEHSGDVSDMEEHALMRRCQHFVIANSTFSWWAAWLATNSKKVVVAPQPWFTAESEEPKDIIPEGWIRVRSKR